MATTTKKNAYEMVTDQVLNAMKNGTCPWHKPWRSAGGVGYISYTSRKGYSWLNCMLLMMQGKDAGEFLTIKQANQLGGKVRKGAKSAMVCFYTNYTREIIKDDGTKGTETFPVLKWYHVFHISDCEGIKSKCQPTAPLTDESITPIETGEKMLKAYLASKDAPRYEDNKERAYYNPATDLIGMPHLTRFESAGEYYSTAFHEAVHSTGHKSRLNRFTKSDNATAAKGKEYSREELVAEIGSAYLCHFAGITGVLDNSAAYLRGWMQHLANNPRDFVVAAGRAEKAVNYILGINK